jgi:hypothetical protein
MKTLVFNNSSSSQLLSIENNNKRNIITKIKQIRFKDNEDDTILIEEDNYNKVFKVDNYEDNKLIVQIENKIHWDDNKEDIKNSFSLFTDSLKKYNVINIFIIINSLLNVDYDNSLE